MGKMFTTKKRVRPVFVEDTDKTMFAEVCPAYGLPADFYEMGAMDELGFYYVLKSLKNGMAEFSDLKSFTVSIDMPGDYKYKIYQKKGNNKNTDYDKTIYQAEVFVTEDDDGKLNADTVVFSNGSSEKSAACSFVNKIKSPTPAQDTETQNKTTGKNNATGKSAAGNPGSSGNVGAVSKSTSSAAEKVRTGVDTFECLYAGIGLSGMITAILALRKRRKTK